VLPLAGPRCSRWPPAAALGQPASPLLAPTPRAVGPRALARAGRCRCRACARACYRAGPCPLLGRPAALGRAPAAVCWPHRLRSLACARALLRLRCRYYARWAAAARPPAGPLPRLRWAAPAAAPLPSQAVGHEACFGCS